MLINAVLLKLNHVEVPLDSEFGQKPSYSSLIAPWYGKVQFAHMVSPFSARVNS